ncbi:uncharacterized protein LOC127850913 [Dreissena polymorpha]|uniref:EGF-like domain-containing protein n=1 Tax=Dreissena polymorpha TaxID=45954 RepID=A0A9D4CWW6_DREPO|nr:uncharacterized protein LOC127850913 [Dreissena polymorpha]KAH3733521.1 hypothetical protein DPMN_039950 [Dreissena polymorpha]
MFVQFFIVASLVSSVSGVDLTYNCPVRNGMVDYAQFNPYSDGLRADTINSLAFQTKGNNDAHILLQHNNIDFNNRVVEIVIGGWSNSLSVIRNQQQGLALSSYRGSLLSGSIFQWFWISWNSGCVKVGKGSTVGGSQIMEWCGLDYSINGIRFSYGYGSGGTFIIPLRRGPIPACESRPCQNGGTCVDTQTGSYKCKCQVGWKGPQCSKRKNACASKPCGNAARCIVVQNGGHRCRPYKGPIMVV